MAKYATLKAAIDEIITTNGNYEISGEDMRDTLKAIVDSLGADYQLVGFALPATDPGTPDQNVAYLAGPGTYSNFGSTTVERGQIGLFKYNGTWSYETLDCGVYLDYEEYPGGDAYEWTFYDSENPDGLTIKIAKTVSGLGNDPDVAISQWWAAQTERKINVLGGYTISIDSLTTSPQALGIFKAIQSGQIIDSITGANKLIFGTDGGGSVTVNASDLPYKATANLINVRTDSGTANNVSIVVRGINDILPAYININEIANHPAAYASAAAALADVPTLYRRKGVKCVYYDDDTQLWIEMLCVDDSPLPDWWIDVENNWIIEGPIETKVITATGGQQLRIAGEKRGNLDDVLNVNVWKEQIYEYDSAALARAAVPANKRKLGAIITYLLDDGWYIDQFIGNNTSNWGVTNNWKAIGPITVSDNAQTFKIGSTDVGAMAGIYENIPDYLYIVTDNNKKILFAVKRDGEFVFGKDCPQQVKDYVATEVPTMIANKVDKETGKSLIDEDVAQSISYITCDEFLYVLTDNEKRLIAAVKKDGDIYFGKGVPTQIQESINAVTTSIANKVDKITGKTLIDSEFANGVNYVESAEYLFVVTDANKRILWAIDKNGLFVFPGGIPLEIQNAIDVKANKSDGKTIKVRLDNENKRIYIRSKLSSNFEVENSMFWRDDENFDYNPCLNFGGTKTIDNDGVEKQVDLEGDNISATETNYGYIGANHGLAKRGKFTVVNHGKSYADIGSEWTNGDTSVILVQILNENTLAFIPKYTESSPGIYNFMNVPAANTILTHVSGATHTSDITLGSRDTSYSGIQWYPSEEIINRKFILDGEEINLSGEYYGNQLDCIEVYEIYDPASFLDKIIENVGTFTQNPLPKDFRTTLRKYIRYSNDYRFTKGGLNVLLIDWMPLVKIAFNSFFPLDVKIMNEGIFGGSTLKYYLPKALPLVLTNGTYDFRIPADFIVNDNLSWTQQYWENPLLPPDRAIEFVCDADGKPIIGLHHGYTFDQGVASGTNRKDYLYNWWVYTSRASYNGALSSQKIGSTIQPYTHYGMVCYRKYEDYTDNVDGLISLSHFEVNGEYYIYADFKSSGIFNIEIPGEWCGKKIEIFEKSDNVELRCGLSESPMLVTVESATPMYGYLVLGLKKNNN